MEEREILDILYEEICENIKIPNELKEKSNEWYDKIVNCFKKYTTNKNEVSELEDLLNEFISSEMDEFLYERKEVFKEAYKASEMLKKELGAMRVVITGNDVQFDSDILEKLFESRIEEIASTTDEEKKRDTEQIKEIAYKNIIPNASKEEIEKLENAISEYVDSIYFNNGEYNKKYYFNGFKDSFGLTFVCSKER